MSDPIFDEALGQAVTHLGSELDVIGVRAVLVKAKWTDERIYAMTVRLSERAVTAALAVAYQKIDEASGQLSDLAAAVKPREKP